MSDNSVMILPQSTTTIASTPPPIASSTATQSSITNRSTINQRLQLYNSLFGESKNQVCKETGLKFTQCLNYSLHTFLHCLRLSSMQIKKIVIIMNIEIKQNSHK